MGYQPANWFWIVGGSASQVWASARLAYVSVTDAAYVAWLAAGNLPSRCNSGADLGGVMMAQVLPGILAAGVALVSTGTPALDGTYALDPTSQAQITGIAAGIAAGRGLPGGGTAFNWQDTSGTPHSFSSAAFTNFAAAMESYVYNYTQALGTLAAGGSAALPTTPVTIA